MKNEVTIEGILDRVMYLSDKFGAFSIKNVQERGDKEYTVSISCKTFDRDVLSILKPYEGLRDGTDIVVVEGQVMLDVDKRGDTPIYKNAVGVLSMQVVGERTAAVQKTRPQDDFNDDVPF